MGASRFRIDGQVIRPWLTGMVVLACLIWAISWLLDTQQVGGEPASEERGEAAAPVAGTATADPASGVMPPVPLADLLPLGPEDDGFRVLVRGTVVAKPVASGFWILTDEDEVLFVQTRQTVTSGQDVELTGTLHLVPSDEGADRAAEAELRGAAGWKVHHDLVLLVDTGTAGAASISEASAGQGGER